MHDPSRFQRLEARLAELTDELERLHRLVPDDREDAFVHAARGLHYAFKAQVLTERVLAFLWQQATSEGLRGKSIVLPTKTYKEIPDIQGYMTEATFRSLHSAGDLLAQVLNQALLGDAIPSDHCSLSELRARLNERMMRQSAVGDVVEAIDKLRGSADMEYLSAFVNYSKHQGYVERQQLTDFREKPILSGTALSAFTYKGHEWSAKSYRQLEEMTGRLHKHHMGALTAVVLVIECERRNPGS